MQDTDTWREKNQGRCINGQVALGDHRAPCPQGTMETHVEHAGICLQFIPPKAGTWGFTSRSHPPWWSAAPGDAQSLNLKGGVVGMWKVPLSPGEPGDPQVIQK